MASNYKTDSDIKLELEKSAIEATKIANQLNKETDDAYTNLLNALNEIDLLESAKIDLKADAVIVRNDIIRAEAKAKQSDFESLQINTLYNTFLKESKNFKQTNPLWIEAEIKALTAATEETKNIQKEINRTNKNVQIARENSARVLIKHAFAEAEAKAESILITADIIQAEIESKDAKLAALEMINSHNIALQNGKKNCETINQLWFEAKTTALQAIKVDAKNATSTIKNIKETAKKCRIKAEKALKTYEDVEIEIEIENSIIDEDIPELDKDIEEAKIIALEAETQYNSLIIESEFAIKNLQKAKQLLSDIKVGDFNKPLTVKVGDFVNV